MPTFLLIIQIVSQLLPMVTGLVQSVETALPSASGATKLSTVQSFLQSAFNALGDVGVTFEQVWPTINAFVTAAVAVYNASGLFIHASSTVNTIASDITQVGEATTVVAQELASTAPSAVTTVMTTAPAPAIAAAPAPAIAAAPAPAIAAAQSLPEAADTVITSAPVVAGGAGPFASAASQLAPANS